MNEIPKAATADHTSNAAIDEAATWLATTRRDQIAGPVVPAIRQRFNLDTLEAIESIRVANLIRARAS